MFKKLLQNLKERKIVSKEDKAILKTLLEELPEEEKESVKADVADVEAKPEEEKKSENKEELKDNVEFKALHEQNVQLSEKLKKIELKEKSAKEYLITKDRKLGFQEADLGDVVNFISTLNEEQVKSFDQLFAKLRNVDLEVKGTTKTGEELSEEKAMDEASKEAEKRATESKRPLHECLAEVYKERGLSK